MLYLDIFSGISGDMFIGALLDLGLPLNHLQAELARLQLSGYHLHARRGRKAGIEGVKFDVHLEDHDHSHDHGPEHGHDHPHADGPAPAHGHDHDHGHHHHDHDHDHGHAPEPGHDHDQDESHDHPHDHGRTHAEIRDLIQRSDLNAWIKARALSVFHRLAVAEGKIHGLPPESVQFHEVGALDSIVDIVGVCVGLDWLGRPPVLAGPVIEGTGFVRCAHGRMPLPAPATLEIFATRGVGITQCDEPGELVTPTGAALLAEFAVSFGRLTGFHPERVGYGLGTRDNRTRPNVLRAVLGQATTEVAAAGRDWETDIVTVLESNLDDISPEMLGHFVERALGAGALDVFHTSVQMKKNRPGTLLTVLCAAEASEMFAELILRETSAFGVRETLASRRKLRREFIKVSTPHGEITIKIGRLNDEVVQLAPEFESCRQAAARTGVPIKTVYETALTRATTQMGRTPATGT